MTQLKITEVALRDGSHAMSHQYTVEQVRNITKGLNAARVPYIEVAHGDGLGGSTIQYGLSKTDELKLIEAAVEEADFSKIAVLLLPGIGTIQDLKEAHRIGAKMVRVATHVTEADVAKQHLETAKNLGMETVGFLMMSHMAPVDKLVEQAKLMESYGADTVYAVDSAGAMLPYEVSEKIKALRDALTVNIGYHAHNNLGLAIGNTLAAIEHGATRIDGSVRALGAGAGNAQTEVLVAVLEKMEVETGIDLYKMMDLAEEVVAPIMQTTQEITKDSLTLGYAGVYSSFRLHAERAAKKFNIDSRDILIELGKREIVGGQEDMIVDVAAELAQKNQVTV
ncbi:4-hydroxy-2-oxovalerate aldolase [Oceanobacillus luteolus]|uniref:4-hydroxy-2-oxovalerate aldolase n=1 Tax=Oceanobacillus luteolus TaxID=1274358 RepID=A0ABW4HV07_9BACI|nr:4-hydroxy-2-oxovalerate aldolase [Oceanobacillus luteolus]MCM3741225.1 4-hydroxy-2-oxovalerate aldolase [Oceanobacillus luteolus]